MWECLSRREESIEARIQTSMKIAQAYPGGNSWDEAFGKMGSGKRFYHNAISEADFAAQSSTQQMSC